MGIPSQAYWGLRFLKFHFVLETTAVIVTGLLIYLRPQLQRSINLGFSTILLLPILHVLAMNLEVGYTVHDSVNDQMHAIDWVYQPNFRERDERLSITVSYPRYTPINIGEPQNDLRLIISKTSSEKLNSSIFQNVADEMQPKCQIERTNTYCRFFVDNAWYGVHHQSLSDSSTAPNLEGMIRDIPEIFKEFKIEAIDR